MSGASTFATLLPGFRASWSLTGTQAGWLSGIYFAGYLAAVPVLVGLTDRVDRRRIYLLSMAIGGASALAFTLFAHGFWSALPLRALAGVALAGTYMPGLKALADRISGPTQSRAVAIYTACFGVGISLSFVTSGTIGAWLGWQWAFAFAALGSLLGYAVASVALEPEDPAARSHSLAVPLLLDVGPVLRDRSVLAYALAYATHTFELFALRSWVVAFFAFAVALHPGGGHVAAPSLLAAAMTAIGIPASIGGNEIALRIGRVRMLTLAMLISASVACVIGFAARMPLWFVAALIVIYGGLVTSDSGSLTAGLIDVSDPRRRGMTMAVYSCIGFCGAFLGPVIFGIVLDHAGGASDAAWGYAFAAMGVVAAMGPFALRAARQPR